MILKNKSLKKQNKMIQEKRYTIYIILCSIFMISISAILYLVIIPVQLTASHINNKRWCISEVIYQDKLYEPTHRGAENIKEIFDKNQLCYRYAQFKHELLYIDQVNCKIELYENDSLIIKDCQEFHHIYEGIYKNVINYSGKLILKSYSTKIVLY